MIAARISALAAVLVVATGCAGAPPTPDQPIVHDLDIEGARAVPPSEIRAKILTDDTSWLPFSEKHYYDEGVLETDLKRILRLYQANGYYKARIVERKVEPRGKGAVDITIRIDEGPPTIVDDLTIEGLDDLSQPERDKLLAGLELQKGKTFTELDYDTFRAVLAERLRQIGFAEAEVNGVVQIHVDQNTASVVINASTGQRFRYGDIFIAGANQVPRWRILEIVRDALPAGKLYSDAGLAEAEARLFDLGVFSAAKVSRGAPDRRAGTVPIVVSVREAPFRTVRVGGGVGFEPQRYEVPRVIADITNRNFFGGLRRLSFNNQVSLVLLSFPGGFKNSQDRGLAVSSALEFQQPNIFRRDLTLTSSLGYEHGIETAYRFDSVTGSLGFVWRVSRSVSVVPSYNLSLFGLNVRQQLADAIRGSSQGAVLDACAQTGRLCRLAYLEQRFSWDRRDNPIASTRGGLLTMSFQEGSGALGGSYDYVRVLPEARFFFPFGPHVLAMRGTGGLLLPVQGSDSSVLTRFYLGGGTSQRGFGNRALSPRVGVVTAARNPDTGAYIPNDKGKYNADALPIGGNGMVAGNIEFRIALPANFGLVPFVDAGAVTQSATEILSSGLHVAVGLGLRYRTLFGPVRLDFGYRVNKLKPGPNPPGINIDDSLVKGQGIDPGLAQYTDVPRYSLHFSIGEAF